MSESEVNNKRVAKNTLILYFRMFITMAVGLYTSRVILNVLGVIDYGIYNVVGGIITMMSFLNVAMVQASQRFIAYELGKGYSERLRSVFSTSVNIHGLIAIIAFIISETIGLWFINAKLNIPEERLLAANWVYQASILTFIVNVISVPYNATIVAHEKMKAFAYISILEVSLKLLIVLFLLIVPFDKLIIYSILMFIVGLSIRSCYTIYCKRNFQECSYYYTKDKKLFKEMLSFAGWSFLGNMGLSFKDNLSNIILNIFCGPAVNAARGIGIHVNAIVNTFVTNFTMALNPQITKQYAIGNVEESIKLVYAGSRYSFFLLTLISIPIIINIDYILYLWLGTVPKYTSQFLILSMMNSLLYSMSSCVTTAIQATGNIKWFQIGIFIIMIMEIPIAWLLLKMNYPPYYVMIPTLITYSIAILFRFALVAHYVHGYIFKDYALNVLGKCLLVFFLSIICCSYINQVLETSFINLITSSIISIIIISCFVFILGMKKQERVFIKKRVSTIINSKYRKYDKNELV